MRISIFGQRSITDPDLVKKAWEDCLTQQLEYSGEEPITFIHGGAKGPQSTLLGLVSAGAITTVYDIIAFRPWTLYDRELVFSPAIFYYRNQQIIDNSDWVILLDNGEKDSEANKIQSICEEYGVRMIRYDINS